MVEPSGEIAVTWLRVLVKPWSRGTTIENRATGGASACGFKYHAAIPAIAAHAIPVTIRGMASFQIGVGAAVVDAVGTALGFFAMVSSSAPKSPADCHRRFGFFCRQRCNTSRMRGFRLADTA